MYQSFYKFYMNQSKAAGITISEKEAKAKVYALYTEAFKKGVYDFMAKEKDLGTGKAINRHYFSGGIDALSAEKITSALTPTKDYDGTIMSRAAKGTLFFIAGALMTVATVMPALAQTERATNDTAKIKIAKNVDQNRLVHKKKRSENAEIKKLFAKLNKHAIGGDIEKVLSTLDELYFGNRFYVPSENDRTKVFAGLFDVINNIEDGQPDSTWTDLGNNVGGAHMAILAEAGEWARDIGTQDFDGRDSVMKTLVRLAESDEKGVAISANQALKRIFDPKNPADLRLFMEYVFGVVQGKGSKFDLIEPVSRKNTWTPGWFVSGKTAGLAPVRISYGQALAAVQNNPSSPDALLVFLDNLEDNFTQNLMDKYLLTLALELRDYAKLIVEKNYDPILVDYLLGNFLELSTDEEIVAKKKVKASAQDIDAMKKALAEAKAILESRSDLLEKETLNDLNGATMVVDLMDSDENKTQKAAKAKKANSALGNTVRTVALAGLALLASTVDGFGQKTKRGDDIAGLRDSLLGAKTEDDYDSYSERMGKLIKSNTDRLAAFDAYVAVVKATRYSTEPEGFDKFLASLDDAASLAEKLNSIKDIEDELDVFYPLMDGDKPANVKLTARKIVKTLAEKTNNGDAVVSKYYFTHNVWAEPTALVDAYAQDKAALLRDFSKIDINSALLRGESMLNITSKIANFVDLYEIKAITTADQVEGLKVIAALMKTQSGAQVAEPLLFLVYAGQGFDRRIGNAKISLEDKNTILNDLNDASQKPGLTQFEEKMVQGLFNEVENDQVGVDKKKANSAVGATDENRVLPVAEQTPEQLNGGIDFNNIKVQAAPLTKQLEVAPFDATKFGGFTFKVSAIKKATAAQLIAAVA
jgi:hypothetical protein